MLAAAPQTEAIITVEEHSVVGGSGNIVVEVPAESGDSCVAFGRIGIKDEFCQQVGSPEYLRAIYGLSVHGLLNLFDLQGKRRKNERLGAYNYGT